MRILKAVLSQIVLWHNPSPYNDYYCKLRVSLINTSGSGQKGDLTLLQASLPSGPVHYLQEFKAVGKGGGERGVRCDREDSHLRVDVGVCPWADCVSKECQKPFSSISVRITPGLR